MQPIFLLVLCYTKNSRINYVKAGFNYFLFHTTLVHTKN